MRISPSPFRDHVKNCPTSSWHRHMPDMQRCRRCEVPSRNGYFFETSVRCPYVVAMMPRAAVRLHFLFDVLELLRAIHRNAGTQWKSSSFTQSEPVSQLSRQVWNPMDQLSGYAHRPFPFVLRYLRQRPVSHLVILGSVLVAVACSVGTQYGVKFLVDSLSAGPERATNVWLAF